MILLNYVNQVNSLNYKKLFVDITEPINDDVRIFAKFDLL